MQIKSNSIILLFLLLTGLCLTSCDHFMTGAQTRDQLEKQIAYANAPEFLIKVTTRDGSGSIAKPAAGETLKKVTDIFDIRFEPLPDFEFVSWQASSQKLAAGQDINDYIEIEDARKAETRVTFKKALEDIVITATVAERAQIISYSPMTSEVLKDSSVLVQFDHDMNEDSIYYTKEEIGKLKLSNQNINFIPSKRTPGRFYGYKIGDEPFYKNISFVDNETETNLTSCYDEPYFANPKMLTINTVKDKPLDDYTPILVTIDKNFFYTFDDGTEKGKSVTLTGSKKWTYQVNDQVDNGLPKFLSSDDIKVSINAGSPEKTELSYKSAEPAVSESTLFNRDKKVNLNIKLTDMESGPDDSFTIVLTKIQNEKYEAIAPVTECPDVKFQRVTSQKGIINTDVDLSSLVKDGLSDGVYKMSFVFRDRSNKSIIYPEDGSNAYYFTVDNKIEMAEPAFEDTSNSSSIKMKYSWTPITDYKKTQIRYKKKSESQWSEAEEFTGVTEKEFSKLCLDTDYDFEITNYDFAGNTQKFEFSKKSACWEELILSGAPAKTVYLAGENFDSSGLEVKVKLSNGTWTSNNYTTDLGTTISTGKTVTITHTIVEADKQTSKSVVIPATYYVAAANALTQTPVKLTGYSGSVSGGVYYKFGDFPQTIALYQEAEWYSTEPAYNGWYLGSDGYFYDKCLENALESYKYSNGTTAQKINKNSSKYFKVEPIIWRCLSTNYDGGKKLLFAEKELFAGRYYCENVSVGGTDRKKRNLSNGTEVNFCDYKYSTVRAYLNGKYELEDNQSQTYLSKGFLQLAFTQTAQEKIVSTNINNSFSNSNNTQDKIFLLSKEDLFDTSFGFQDKETDNARERKNTDFAIANYASNSYYWTRTKTTHSSPCMFPGQITINIDKYAGTDSDHCGIVPALCVSYLP